jgi:hypothetical protein
MNSESTFCITGAVRAGDSVSTSSPSSTVTIPTHHPSQYIPRPYLRIVPVTAIDEPDGEQVWTELERMLAAREAARALHPAGADFRTA